MRRGHDQATRIEMPAHQSGQHRLRGRIERGCGFVEQPQRARRDEQPRQGDAAPLSRREIAARQVGGMRQRRLRPKRPRARGPAEHPPGPVRRDRPGTPDGGAASGRASARRRGRGSGRVRRAACRAPADRAGRARPCPTAARAVPPAPAAASIYRHRCGRRRSGLHRLAIEKRDRRRRFGRRARPRGRSRKG